MPPKMPDVRPFDEASYAHNRFYSPKLGAYRKHISYEVPMNDIKRSVQKFWKTQKDLIELETNIISVQSLALTAHCNANLKRLQNDSRGRGGGGGQF